MSEKCFCHIKNSVTGERYAVKDATARKEIEEIRSIIGEEGNNPSGAGTGGSLYNHYTSIVVTENSGDFSRTAKIYLHHVHTTSDTLDRTELFNFFGQYVVFPATGYMYYDESGYHHPIYGVQFLSSTQIRVHYIHDYHYLGVYDFTMTDVQNSVK